MANINIMFLKKYLPLIVGLIGLAGLIFFLTGIKQDKSDAEDGESIAEVKRADVKAEGPDWTRDRTLWMKRKQLAIETYHSNNREEGMAMLGEMLRWNWSTELGVNLTGVNVGEVLSRVKMPNSEVSIFDYLKASGSRSGSNWISFANSDLDGAIPPDTNLRGISFAGAKASGETWEAWMRERGGRGLEGCNLSETDLSGVNTHGVSLKGANLNNSGIKPDFSDGIMGKFDDTKLSGVSFDGLSLVGVSLRYSDLSKAKISSEQLVDVARSNGGSGLRGAVLPPSDFSGEAVDGLTMQFANLEKVTMTDQQLATIASQWNGMGLYGAIKPVGDGGAGGLGGGHGGADATKIIRRAE
jgi:uncharacterized protein YjbI with pentapeptide repeats